MSQVEPAAAASRERSPGWDAALVVLLGLVLLGAGWRDGRTFLHHRGKPVPEFDFLDPQGSSRLGADEIYRSADTFALLENIGTPERRDGPTFRFAFGPASVLQVNSTHPRARLSVAFYNDVPDQDITVRCNDAVVERFAHQPKGVVTRDYPLDLRPGINTVSFGFARYNHGPGDFGLPDPRPLAGSLFVKLELHPE